MRAAYIGILDKGTTSWMRAQCLKELTPQCEWEWIDTAEPYHGCSRIAKSLAFRLKSGPVLQAVNRAVVSQLEGRSFDLVWVDKAVFLWPETVKRIRSRTKLLIHYTPDCAFLANGSRHFRRCGGLYDLLVTTKSFEAARYQHAFPGTRVFFTTQAFDNGIHFPRNQGESPRRPEAVFVGLWEPDREHCIDQLLAAGIPVHLAGRKWEKFVRKREGNKHLQYAGPGIFGNAYAEMLSNSWIGLGLLSRRFPELHTTRTFEIPACGAVLATLRNPETERFFEDSEALFARHYHELVMRLKELLEDEPRMKRMSEAGRARVIKDRRDYRSVIASILTEVGISGNQHAGLAG